MLKLSYKINKGNENEEWQDEMSNVSETILSAKTKEIL